MTIYIGVDQSLAATGIAVTQSASPETSKQIGLFT
jgi:hypothetical protein